MLIVPDMKQRLEASLKTRYPQRQDLSVVELEWMSGGFSYLTYFFTVTWKEAQGPVSESLVIRVQPELGCIPPYDIRPQYKVMKTVYGMGVPVPKVYWLETDSQVLGQPFFVMEKIEGGELLLDAFWNQPQNQAQLVKDYTSVLAKIHGLDQQALGLSFPSESGNNRHYAEKEIDKWEWVTENNQYTHQPVMAELCSWLRRNIPPAERITLCHGDFHVRNLIAREGHVVATLDWEMAGIGDPISDLGWACLFIRFLGFWSEADFIQSYEEITEVKVSEDSLFFWLVLSYVKLAAIALAGLRTSIESKNLDVRQILDGNFSLTLQDTAAQLLGF